MKYILDRTYAKELLEWAYDEQHVVNVQTKGPGFVHMPIRVILLRTFYLIYISYCERITI
jgi:hypothetical protein